jgi:hypothetical protein
MYAHLFHFVRIESMERLTSSASRLQLRSCYPLARWHTRNSAGRVQAGIIGHLTKMLVLVIRHDLFGSNLNWQCTHRSDTALSTVKSALRHLLECKPCVIKKTLIASALSLAGKWTRCSYAAASAISGFR